MKRFPGLTQFILVALLGGLLLSACDADPTKPVTVAVVSITATATNPAVNTTPVVTPFTAQATTPPGLSPGSTTQSPLSTTASTGQAASLDLVVNPATIKIGQEVTVTGSVVNMGIPAYTLYIDDKLYATDKSTAVSKDAASSKVEFVSAMRQDNKGVFGLRGIEAGKVKISMSANGEISVKSGSGSAFIFSNVGPGSFELIITAS